MERPDFLDTLRFNWETFDILFGGVSSLDAKNYLSHCKTKEQAVSFLDGYGFDVSNPVENAELFGNFQEAVQFIKRYFLKEGNEEGLDLEIPNIFYTITDVSELTLIATGSSETKTTVEDSIWAGIILKVMHTILHTDKDLRYRYFTTIQTQIFDRYYRFLHRDSDDNLFYVDEEKKLKIPLVEFETKSKKSRESTIIKLLHKKENVAEELFDRIGIRFVTERKIDVLRLISNLQERFVVIANNIKPSRSQNSLINIEVFRESYYKELRDCLKNDMPEEEFLIRMEQLIKAANNAGKEDHKNNEHTSNEYRAIHFTCRQLIKYRNPFLKQYGLIRDLAREDESSELAQKILSLDTSTIAQDIRFFYPYELQITDRKSHEKNTYGDASHNEYKKSQLHSAKVRLFKNLIDYHNIRID